MESDGAAPESLIPLKSKDHYILAALLDGDRHGYAIAKEVLRRSGGKVRVEAGNLHRHLQKLMRLGLVVRAARKPVSGTEDERRRYYTVTDLGRRAWELDIAHMERLVRAARVRRSAPSTRGV